MTALLSVTVADRLWTSWSEAGLVALSAVLVLAALIITIRVVGLRSLSKMSSFDFAVTVAMGSILASVAATSTSVADGVVALAALLGTQALIAWVRVHVRRIGTAVDNEPVLLMRDSEFVDAALEQSRVTRNDVYAKLREANVLDLGSVRAVVLETTGDISVLHGDGEVAAELLGDVRNV